MSKASLDAAFTAASEIAKRANQPAAQLRTFDHQNRNSPAALNKAFAEYWKNKVKADDCLHVPDACGHRRGCSRPHHLTAEPVALNNAKAFGAYGPAGKDVGGYFVPLEAGDAVGVITASTFARTQPPRRLIWSAGGHR